MAFKVGQRVRTTVDAPNAPGFESEPHYSPAGALGTITDVFDKFGEAYGVLLDGDPYKLPAHYDAEELEAI